MSDDPAAYAGGRTSIRSSADPLTAAKLAVPALPTCLVTRPRLLRLLSAGAQGPLTLLAGAAGTGKTVLLASWLSAPASPAARVPGRPAWLSLDDADNRPGLFWSSVTDALHRHGVRLPSFDGLPACADSVDRSFLSRLAIDLAGQDVPTVLVLDGYDAVTDPAVAHGLDFVLRNAAGRLRLVLATRMDPPLALHRYRLSGELTEIRGDQLAFTPVETSVLLDRHGLALSPPALAGLYERTEGWAAGLRLSALWLAGRPDPDQQVAQLAADAATIAEYLVDEVLDAQPPAVRDLLLRTSVLAYLHPDLADELTGRRDARQTIVDLARGNVFVHEVPEAPGWWRYHPLFAEVLRARLQYEQPEAVAGLHQRAARWLGRAGRLAAAVRHAVAVGDWRYASSQVIAQLAVGPLLLAPDADGLADALRTIPAQAPGPEPATVAAALALTEFRVEDCRGHLHRAIAQAVQTEPVLRVRLHLSITLIDLILARMDADVGRAVNRSRRVEDLLLRLPAELVSRHPEIAALARSSTGTVLLWAGRLDEADAVLNAAVEIARAPGAELPRLNSLGQLAVLEVFRGRLHGAEQLGQAAASLAQHCALPAAYRTAAGDLARAWVAYQRNELPRARRHLADAAAGPGARRDVLVGAGIALVRARILASTGSAGPALQALHSAREAAGRPLPDWIDRRLALEEVRVHAVRGSAAAAWDALARITVDGIDRAVLVARVHLATGAPGRALQVLPVLHAGLAVPVDVILDGLLVQAVASHQVGEDEPGRRLLADALRMAEPERYRRPILEAGRWVRQLLREDPAFGRARRWLPDPLQRVVPVRSPAGDGPGRRTGRSADRRSAERERPAGQGPTRRSPDRGGPAGDSTAPLDGPLIEPLTERERVVLGHLAQLLSTEEVAAELYVSVNTVKTHLKNIYRKLAVARRSEAIRRARQLDLI